MTKNGIKRKKHIRYPDNDMKPATLGVIGTAIGGTHWQADVARETEISKSMITRFRKPVKSADHRFMDVGWRLSLLRMMLHKIEGLVDLLTIEGMPGENDPVTISAQEKIKAELAKIRKGT